MPRVAKFSSREELPPSIDPPSNNLLLYNEYLQPVRRLKGLN